MTFLSGKIISKMEDGMTNTTGMTFEDNASDLTSIEARLSQTLPVGGEDIEMLLLSSSERIEQ